MQFLEYIQVSSFKLSCFLQDIRNQRRYRQRRKQELTKLKQNMEMLDQKAKFFEEQSDYYNQYIKSCLASLANKSKK